MLVYLMLKPGFVTKENIVNLRENYITPENGFQVMCDGFVRYDENDAKKHYENLKYKPFYKDVAEYIASDDTYSLVASFNGDENQWKAYRKQIIGGTHEKDLIPGSFRYDMTIGKGLPYSDRQNVIHSSDSYNTATNEISIFLKLMGEYAKKEALEGNKHLAEDIIMRLKEFCLGTEVEKGLYQFVDEYGKVHNIKFSESDLADINSELMQLCAISRKAEKVCKKLEPVYDRVKYHYVKNNEVEPLF